MCTSGRTSCSFRFGRVRGVQVRGLAVRPPCFPSLHFLLVVRVDPREVRLRDGRHPDLLVLAHRVVVLQRCTNRCRTGTHRERRRWKGSLRRARLQELEPEIAEAVGEGSRQ